MSIILVALGGGLGAILRYFLAYSLTLSSYSAILMINFLGSFIIGYFFKQVDSQLWYFVVIGFCGAFTTFSTYSLETIRMLMAGNLQQLVIYILLMNSVCILSCWLGVKIAT